MGTDNSVITKKEQNSIEYTLYDGFHSYSCYHNPPKEYTKELKFPSNYGMIFESEFAEWPLLEKVTISKGLEKIESGAFANNTKCSEVMLPSTLKEIGERAFYKNPLTRLKIPNSVTKIGDQAFYGNKCLSIKVPSSVVDLGSNVFDGWNLKSLTLPTSLSCKIKENRASYLEDVHVKDDEITLKNPRRSFNEYDTEPGGFSDVNNVYIETDEFKVKLFRFQPSNTLLPKSTTEDGTLMLKHLFP